MAQHIGQVEHECRAARSGWLP